jgi:hypothetical protein
LFAEQTLARPEAGIASGQETRNGGLTPPAKLIVAVECVGEAAPVVRIGDEFGGGGDELVEGRIRVGG